MKINEKFIDDIFNNKIELKNEKDKIKLSSYTDIIPMYDIYTQKIYPIKKENIYFRLVESHYRFINNEVKNWIQQTFEKYKKRLDGLKGEERKQMEDVIQRLTIMIKIIHNYHIETLIDTSYRVLYKYSGIGLTISICKRNSFHPFINYLKPYYSRNELIKLGQNMGLLNKEIKPENLIDESKHFEICKFISNNDVSFDEIKTNTLEIIKNKTLSDVCFYSFIGASLLNRFLRNQDVYSIDTFYFNRLTNIVNTIKSSPKLEKDYQIYRFVSNDDFIKELDIGETFNDPGFISTTRDPFYSPGISGNFGLILIKINLKKNIVGEGLFIEHFSLFPKEEEFLLPPYTTFKLISKDDNFKYYHTNSNFEKLITKKYEFELVNTDYSFINNIKYKDEKIPDLPEFNFKGNTRMDLFQKFKNITNKYNQIYINNLVFTVLFFDSTGAYGKFYQNKIDKGLSLIHFDKNGYPLIFIELGKELVINYINQYYFYYEKEDVNEKDFINLIIKIGKIFNYKKAIIYHNQKNFSEFKNNYYENQHPFLYINHYNQTLYNYIKNDINRFKFEPFYQDNLKDIEIILNKNGNKKKLIECIEKDFNQYTQMVNELGIDKLSYGVLNIYEKLLSEGLADIMVDLEYSDEGQKDDNLDLIFRQPIRRGTE